MPKTLKTAAIVMIVASYSAGADEPSAETESPELWLHERLIETVETQDGPNAFSTDGCSGGMSDVWRLIAWLSPEFVEAHGQTPPWETCCVAHDRIYHDAAGAQDAPESWQARYDADVALRACVAEAAPDQVARLEAGYGMSPDTVIALYRILSDTMFHAVRLGGVPCSGLPWRWGYGYRHCDPLQ